MFTSRRGGLGLLYAGMLAASALSVLAAPCPSAAEEKPIDGPISRVARASLKDHEAKLLQGPASVSSPELTASGSDNLGTFMMSLPAIRGGISEYLNNGSDGTSKVDLRGLGTLRALVLIDGRRAGESAVDLNLIPTAIVDRIDVSDAGGAAFWGADAISGVINVKLKDRVDGFHLDAQYGFAAHDNANAEAR